MKKLFLLSFMFAITCSEQVFSEVNEYNGFEVNDFTRFLDESQSDNKIDNFKSSFNKFILSNKSYDAKDILSKFREWSSAKVEKLRTTNPEILANVDLLICYLLGAAQQSKEDNSTKSNFKTWENTFSDFKKTITGSKKSSTHEMLYVFIYAFSSNSSNDKAKKEAMKTVFKTELLRNKLVKEEYNKNKIKLLKNRLGGKDNNNKQNEE